MTDVLITRRKSIALMSGLPFTGRLSAAKTEGTKNVIVWAEPGRFGGWPANHGIWSWNDEIVVGFRAGYFKRVERGHAIDRDKPSEEWQARSKDGGETWTVEKPPGIVPPRLGGKEPMDCPGGVDFTVSGFALMCRASGGREGESRFYWTDDRANSWQGPYKLPNFGQPDFDARTDYIVNGEARPHGVPDRR